jgi:CDP-diacylglycerol--glycerol-3-phosphate 3-phosphatidyltransferase
VSSNGMKYLASLITAGRIAGAFTLLFIKPLSVLFFVIYALCCASDVLDGYVARKTHSTSKLGATFDSIADFVFIAVVLVIFLPLISFEKWMLYWIAVIACVRFTSLVVGFVKYRALAFLHTYGNKATGIVLACFPVLYQVAGLNRTALIICSAATLSALEELAINLSRKDLNRNCKGIWDR